MLALDQQLDACASGYAVVEFTVYRHRQLFVRSIALRKIRDILIVVIVKIRVYRISDHETHLRAEIYESSEFLRAEIDMRQHRNRDIGQCP